MKLAKIELNNISEKVDPFAIKNFIISDKALTTPQISSDYPVVLDGVAFIICVKGKGKSKINFKEYDIRENTIITILPYFITEIVEKDENLVLEYLVFSTDFLPATQPNPNFDILKHIIISPCIQATKEETDRLLEFHSFIVQQYKRNEHPFREAMAKTLLFGLLIEIGAIYHNRFVKTKEKDESGPASRQEEIVTRFFRLLVENHKKEKSLQFYADKMFLTSKYLSTVLKERTGRTAQDWINEALISSAKYMLKTTDMTVSQISEELNFPNPSFFGRFFKKHSGITPVKYKQS